MPLPLCYSCGEPIISVVQTVEGNTTYINFMHKYGDSCVDIIEIDYLLDPKNAYYFAFVRDIITQLAALEPPK